MALTGTIEQAILNHFLGTTAYTFVGTLYLALFTVVPSMPAGTGGTEVSGGAYARMPITFTSTGSGPAIASNSALVQFATATANWGTVNGAGIYTALTGGQLIDANSLAVAKTIGTGDTFAMPAGNYTVSQT